MSSDAQGRRVGRVALNALSQVVGGGVSVARDLADALAHERPEAYFSLFCVAGDLARHSFPGNVEVIHRPDLAGFSRRTGWEQLSLPKRLVEGRFDALLTLGGFAVFRSPVAQVSVWQNPNIFTRVDVSRPAHVDAYIRVQRVVQGLSMRRVDMNVFLTRQSLEEAATRWDMSRIPHTVIPNGLSALPEPATDVEVPGQPYVFAVGHSYFHKNYEALIDAALSLRTRFGLSAPVVVAGGAVDADYHARLEERIRSRGLVDSFRFLGAQSPERVAALYARASVYVMTSVLESFGLTPLEAMAHGVPVVVGAASCMPEVCGDAALYCDPRDPEDIAEKLHRVLTDPTLRADLVARGRERAGRYSWAESARRYLAALDASAQGHPMPEAISLSNRLAG